MHQRMQTKTSVILPATIRVPPASRLGVRLQTHRRKQLLVVVLIHQVPDLPAKTYRQFTIVRRLNDLGPWLTAHGKGRQEVGGEFALGMPRRHIHDQAFQLAIDDAVKGVGHLLVVRAEDGLGPNVTGEVNERLSALFLSLKDPEP
jgi:hypothetical protein